MALITALLGLLAGVLVNRVADLAPDLMRDRERARVMPDPRRCRCCGASLRSGWDFALWRFAVCRGRCAGCGTRLPLRPLIVELVAALAFGYLWLHDVDPAAGYAGSGNLVRLALHMLFTTVFLLVTVTDLEHRLILDAVMLPAVALALAGGVLASLLQLAPGPSWRAVLIGGFLAFVLFYIIEWTGNRFFGVGAFGFGDVTLATFIGLVTGFPYVLVAIVIGILTGGVITALLLLTRVRSLRSVVPYGPFLVAGGLATMLWGAQIVAWYFGR